MFKIHNRLNLLGMVLSKGDPFRLDSITSAENPLEHYVFLSFFRSAPPAPNQPYIRDFKP